MRVLLSLLLSSVIFIVSCSNDEPSKKEQLAVQNDSSKVKPVKKIQYDTFGFPFDSARVSDYKVKPNESLYEILDRFEISPRQIYSITQKARDVVNLRSFKPGQRYRTYASSDSTQKISRLVWQPDPVDYVVFDWQDSLDVYKKKKKIITRRTSGSAEITSSLYEAMMEQNLTPLLAHKLSEIYAWEIDFFNLRKGDSFKVFYEQKYVDGEFYSTGRILAAEFTHRGKMHKAFRFEGEEVDGYFDEEGKSVQKALLKAPFTYDQRISSGFSRSRFHPILKRRMPHYGVDYAAPYGTPVLATGDGTVIEAQYRGANGNIIKIHHNSTYTTAYLHLKGFTNGVHRGATVKQGQIIGYVGNTGRVTGTHLDYRIYKNNSPVNPLTVDLPSSESVPKESMDRFIEVKSYLQYRLNQIENPRQRMASQSTGTKLAR